jgi:hypothetical protein
MFNSSDGSYYGGENNSYAHGSISTSAPPAATPSPIGTRDFAFQPILTHQRHFYLRVYFPQPVIRFKLRALPVALAGCYRRLSLVGYNFTTPMNIILTQNIKTRFF